MFDNKQFNKKILRFRLIDIIDNYRHTLLLPDNLVEKAKYAKIISFDNSPDDNSFDDNSNS